MSTSPGRFGGLGASEGMTTNSPLGLNNLTLDVGQTVYATAFFAAAAPAAATM